MKVLSLEGLTYLTNKLKAWVTDNFSTKTEVSAKQDKLTAGSNITISGGTISAKDTTYSTASTSANGLMSSSDKSKLDGIATGANKTTVDSALSSSSTNPVQNKVINSALNGKLSTSGTAAKATADASGNNIADTYETKANAITGLSVSGRTITYTKGDGATGTITTQDNNTDTKNTAGSTDSSSKLFIIGATSQATNPQTYSHDTAYIGTDGKLYSGGKVVIASGDKATSAGTADSATKATQDGSGNTITSTYETKANAITGLSVSGKTITYTKGNGTTGTITTQDTNTTYSNMTGATSSAAGKAGLVPAPASGKQGQYLRGDGTWATPTNTTYSVATTSANGLMSSSDKSKLDGIQSGADAVSFSRSLTSGTKIGTITINGTATDLYCEKNTDTNTTYDVATTSANGLMSSSDKSKLDGIATGANKTTVDSSLSSTSTNPVQNKVINSALAGKQATMSAGTGISLNGATINHSNSITAKTSYVGSATAVPRIQYDAQGHITACTTATIYAPTTAGSAGQIWVSDGSGAGTWKHKITMSTSDPSGGADGDIWFKYE